MEILVQNKDLYKAKVDEVERFLSSLESISVEDPLYEYEDYDGPVGDFLYGCRLVSHSNPQVTVWLNLYWHRLSFYVNGKYKIVLENKEIDEMVSEGLRLLTDAQQKGFKETLFRLGGKTVYSRIVLPKYSYVSNETSLTKGWAVLKPFAKKTLGRVRL